MQRDHQTIRTALNGRDHSGVEDRGVVEADVMGKVTGDLRPRLPKHAEREGVVVVTERIQPPSFAPRSTIRGVTP
jgi:hypothetical protein